MSLDVADVVRRTMARQASKEGEAASSGGGAPRGSALSVVLREFRRATEAGDEVAAERAFRNALKMASLSED